MTPLVDMHCHLLAGLDDGPDSWDEALRMCQIAWDDGIRSVAATAHMNPRWPGVTRAAIRQKTGQLAARLREMRLPLSVYPSAEVAVRPDLAAAWTRKELLGVADRAAYVLVELPFGTFVDIREMVLCLHAAGVRPIVAHPERHTELLHDPGAVENLIDRGALMQITCDAITDPPDLRAGMAVRRWVERGVVHLLGSDGHSAGHRPPRMADAYRQIAVWVGRDVADRLCSLHGLAVLEGRPLRLPAPRRAGKTWFSFLGRAFGAAQDRGRRHHAWR